MVDYLQQHGAVVSAVLLPLRNWNHGLPEGAEYNRRAREICAAHGVPVTDLQWTIPDTDFADASHLNYRGEEVTTRTLGDIARTFLAGAGLIAK
jgi:hypothetical protein